MFHTVIKIGAQQDLFRTKNYDKSIVSALSSADKEEKIALNSSHSKTVHGKRNRLGIGIGNQGLNMGGGEEWKIANACERKQMIGLTIEVDDIDL